MAAQTPGREIRLCVLGESSVGKTSILRRYVYGTPDEGHEGPLGEFLFDLQVEAAAGLMDIRLTVLEYRGGRLASEAPDEPAFRGKHGFLAVADLSEPRSLYALEAWVPAVAAVIANAPHRVFLNKTDLASDRVGPYLRWLQTHLPGVPVSSGSAQTGEGVREALDALLLEAVDNSVGRPDGLEVSEAGMLILRYAAKRGPVGVTLKELMRIVRTVDFQGLIQEVDALVHLRMVTREDFGPASFRITITERGESIAQWVAA